MGALVAGHCIDCQRRFENRNIGALRIPERDSQQLYLISGPLSEDILGLRSTQFSIRMISSTWGSAFPMVIKT